MPFSTYRLFQLGLALCVAIFTICFAILATLSFTPLYYFDVQHLAIAEQSGISLSRIVDNYNYTIRYLLNPLPKTFDLPSLAYSTAGRIHFQDVKRLFIAVDFMFVVTGVISIVGIWKHVKLGDFHFLRTAAIALTLFTVIPLTMFAIDFNGTFILFHELFFRNNYWIFDPHTDPIITILPEAFFLHAALFILGIIITGIIVMTAVYRKKCCKK
ncbi:TIGR01906 family membrane protein [Sporolactobacillus nakayamae]|uniref:Integral membrane protein TIGR01906 n=1 Tax=Sporolactobacillus nakayamae TaxID=269670 RepID=A0A1I2NRR9_9BACL|nr:TIGR01906 family membrane protein [Sporolactobacillus nakayamae]SFG05439.1 integral membrane protein TIGR01906 [Sporolactobacillus nakayamae]